jgi:hypothetical protein
MPLRERIARPLVATGATVAGAGLVVEVVHARSHADPVETLVGLCSLSYEANLPTWFASVLLFSCGLLLAAIASDVGARGGDHRPRWIGLAAGFFYMSIDEAVELHEHLGGHFGGEGILYFDWVIPAAIIVALVGAVYLPFLRDLPPRRRRQFLLAGAVYVGGAVLAELPLGWWTAQEGPENATYALLDWVEESLELLGASLFLLALAERWDQRAEARP